MDLPLLVTIDAIPGGWSMFDKPQISGDVREANEGFHVVCHIGNHHGHRRLDFAHRRGYSLRRTNVAGTVWDCQDQHRVIVLVVCQATIHAVVLLTVFPADEKSGSTRRAISVAACGREKRCADADIRLRLCSSRSSESVAITASSGPLATRPPPTAATRSALRRSGPGIASNMTTGSSERAASANVNPPGLVTNKDAVCIKAGTSSTQPSTLSDERATPRLSSFRRMRALWPVIATTCIRSSLSQSRAATWSIRAGPIPPPIKRTTVARSSSP